MADCRAFSVFGGRCFGFVNPKRAWADPMFQICQSETGRTAAGCMLTLTDLLAVC